MKKFILAFLIFSASLAIPVIAYYDHYGEKDWGYKRFLKSGNKSLIIGLSRAAQGIVPSIINSNLDTAKYTLPIYNFSFTQTTSPYGELYYNAIRRKLSKKDYNNGLFIVSVNPWALSKRMGEEEDLIEEQGCLNYVHAFYRPNIEYIIKNFQKLDRHSNYHLHDDGWLEVTAPMDAETVEKRIERKKEEYKDNAITRNEYRIKWLKKTIEMLKKKGTVYLVRIPAHKHFIDLEHQYWPSFDSDMKKIASLYHIHYISFAKDYDKYQTTDGNHLYKEYGKKMTKALCDTIKALENI